MIFLFIGYNSNIRVYLRQMSSIDHLEKQDLYNELKSHVEQLRNTMFQLQNKDSKEHRTPFTMSITTVGDYIDELVALKNNTAPLVDRLYKEYTELFDSCVEIKNEIVDLKQKISDPQCNNSNKKIMAKKIGNLRKKLEDDYDMISFGSFKTGGEHIARDYEEGILYKFTESQIAKRIKNKYLIR